MKVTFVSPYYQNIWEPLGIAYIIAYCKNHTSGIEFDFAHGNFDDDGTILKKCLESDIVAISTTTPTSDYALRLAKTIKSKNVSIITVLGGWHPTTIPREDHYFHNINISVIGEGEAIMPQIIRDEIWQPSTITSKDYLSFDDLPWPDRAAVKQERHLDLCHRMCGLRIASFQSRRGCPMNCAFCGEHCMSGDSKVRVRDPEDLLDEIDSVYTDYEIDMFKFLDPTWVAPISAAYDFCQAKIRRGNHLPWEAMGHAGFITKDLLALMVEANCKQINIGVESGSLALLKDMRKGVTPKKIKKVFRWCHDLDLEVRGFFLLGMPNETLQTAEETFDLIQAIEPDVFGMTILCPYPGSDFYDPIEHADIDWSKADEYSNNFWKTKNLCNDDLKRIQGVFAEAFKDKIAPHMKEVIGV